MDLSALTDWMLDQKQPKFRAKQVYEWLWKHSASSFDEMSSLSKGLREQLNEHFFIDAITTDVMQHSNDGTVKSRFKLHDGHLMESVLIPVPNQNRYTVCVSCQVGCSLTCAFCATGRMDRERNLTAGEIYDQVAKVNAQCIATFGHPLTNIVYMGMGEPLLAYKPVKESIERISSPDGLNMSARRITVSTAGIAKMIKKAADDGARYRLALSLHAADDEKRSSIMPINESNTLEVLMEALTYFYHKTKERMTYEYIAFGGFNLGMDDAAKLAALCKNFPVKVNIIEYNPIGGTNFKRADPQEVDAFAARLTKLGVNVTVRRSRGRDIDAACGQLANKE